MPFALQIGDISWSIEHTSKEGLELEILRPPTYETGLNPDIGDLNRQPTVCIYFVKTTSNYQRTTRNDYFCDIFKIESKLDFRF